MDGRLTPGLAYALTPQELPDATQVFAPAGPGPADEVAQAVRLAVAGGTVHLGRLLAPAGVRYVVVVDALAPSLVGSSPASVSAPPPAGLNADLLEQNDLQVVPGVLGAQVYENGADMPVTAARATALPVQASAYPSAADVAGWQSVLSPLSSGGPATGTVPAGTLYAGYAPAGSFTLTLDGHTVARQPAFGWAAQYAASAKGGATLSLSQFPFVPLVVLLELAAWVLLALALIGRRRGPLAPSTVTSALPVTESAILDRDGDVLMPAHVSRQRRWRVAALVVLVVAGVGIAVAVRGAPVPVAAAPAPSALVGAPDAESSAWYCTGQSTAGGASPGFLVLTNTTARPVAADITATSDSGATADTTATVPAHGVAHPGRSRARIGLVGVRDRRHGGGGVAVTQTVKGSLGWSQAPCQTTTSPQWYFAGGSTAAANTLSVSLLNPTSTPVVVDLSFVTPGGMVHPINYQGIVLQPGQVAAEDVASEVQQVNTVSTIVSARTGRVVASEVQGMVGAGATSGGLALVPGVATPQAHWAIPQAQEVAGGNSEVDVFNPGPSTEAVTVQFRLPSGPLAPLTDKVLPGTTWVLPTSSQTRLPAGETYTTTDRRHGRARRRRGPDREHPRFDRVAPGRNGRGRGRSEHHVALGRVGGAATGDSRQARRQRGRPGVPGTAQHLWRSGELPSVRLDAVRRSRAGHGHAGRRQRGDRLRRTIGGRRAASRPGALLGADGRQ